ncbi:hypothetical protein [Nonomuraea sp. NPDC049646]|uniref:hypothetical protein n=1 Tax=unclassified Nonomuraea TaxID=2593643 RepID=UPI00379A9C2A
MALTSEGLHDLMRVMLACVCEALDEAALAVEGHPGCPCRACVVAGPPAWDQCTDPCGGDQVGGQLTVHLERIFPSTEFPQEDRQVRGTPGCRAPATTAAEIVVTLLRCAPVLDERGCPPACEVLESSARTVHVDAATVYSALMCCLPHTAGRRGRRFLMGRTRVLGPQGGCVGVETRVIVALAGCAPCPGDIS